MAAILRSSGAGRSVLARFFRARRPGPGRFGFTSRSLAAFYKCRRAGCSSSVVESVPLLSTSRTPVFCFSDGGRRGSDGRRRSFCVLFVGASVWRSLWSLWRSLWSLWRSLLFLLRRSHPPPRSSYRKVSRWSSYLHGTSRVRLCSLLVPSRRGGLCSLHGLYSVVG